MGAIESSIRDVRLIDDLARQDTFVHRLDPRVKILATVAFVASVVSFGRYELAALVPYLFYLLMVMGAGNIPPVHLLKRLLVLAPFVVLVGVFNPLYDRKVLATVGGVAVTGGWVSFAAILLRYCLTVSAALLLVACTGFQAVCWGLERMGVPDLFVVQLLLLYRYMFVLTDETARMARARSLRSFKRGAMKTGVYIPLVGALLVRTVERAQRIHAAMLARGFDGRVRVTGRRGVGAADIVFLAGWTALFVLFRLVNVPSLFGKILMGVVQGVVR